MKLLSVIANQQKMGTVEEGRNHLVFRYTPTWQAAPGSFPLSTSMPVMQDEHPQAKIEPYLWNLLPDNPKVLEQWGKRFQVSHNNVFRLLEHVGEDCAGAIQFIPEAREAELLDRNDEENVEWIDEADLAHRISTLLQDHGAQRTGADQGQFSLAGAQPKTALYQSPATGKWGIPGGQTPTTHILKPASNDFPGYAENEHFCLTLTAQLGIKTASSSVLHCDGVPVICVKRYDRYFKGERCYRIHQEDFCQARALPPSKKYQNDGGPSIEDVANTIWNLSNKAREDIETFARALIVNFLISGTDAHAKNYSLLIAGDNQVRLAPLYDISSALPYPTKVSPHKARMAMKVGSKYKLKEIEARHWETCAKHLRLKTKDFMETFETVCRQLPEACSETSAKLRAQGLTHEVIEILTRSISERSESVRKQFFPSHTP